MVEVPDGRVRGRSRWGICAATDAMASEITASVIARVT
jgi:hypothetical protein